MSLGIIACTIILRMMVFSTVLTIILEVTNCYGLLSAKRNCLIGGTSKAMYGRESLKRRFAFLTRRVMSIILTIRSSL